MTVITQEEKQSKICELHQLVAQNDYTARKVVFEIAEMLKKIHRGIELPEYEKYKENEEKSKQWRKIIDMLEIADIDSLIYDEFLSNPDAYKIINNNIVEKDNYQEEIQQKEIDRISKLCLTAADVERGILKAKGLDFKDVIEKIIEIQPSGIDIKAVEVELGANLFIRGNVYVDIIGNILGFTKEQLDSFFETGDYKALL